MPITQTIILHLKEGVSLENVTPDTKTEAVQTFIQSNDMIKNQPGFVRQFWGHQVEDPGIFVWSVEWQSLTHTTSFSQSADHDQFIKNLTQIFDFEAMAPLTIYTDFPSSTNPSAAFSAPVTEVVFYSLPNQEGEEGGVAREEARKMIEKTDISGLEDVVRVGKSTGGGVGWVLKTIPPTFPSSQTTPSQTSQTTTPSLHALFGFPSISDHIKWRQTPEHAQLLQEFAQSPLASLGFKDDVKIPGGNIFVEDSGMFHVRFREGL